MRMTEFPVLGEIKDEYTEHRYAGSTREEAVKKLMNTYRAELEYGEDDVCTNDGNNRHYLTRILHYVDTFNTQLHCIKNARRQRQSSVGGFSFFLL